MATYTHTLELSDAWGYLVGLLNSDVITVAEYNLASRQLRRA